MQENKEIIPLEKETVVEPIVSRKERRHREKMAKRFSKQLNKKQTLKKVQIGNFEVRISEEKVEIEDNVNKLSKHVYSIVSFEGSLISHLLSPLEKDEAVEGGYRTKTDAEIKTGVENVNLLIVGLIYTNLIFSNEEFRAKYFALVNETIHPKQAKKVSKKKDKEIIEEMKTKEQMKEAEK